MVVPRSEVDGLVTLGQLHGNLYRQVEQHFSATFLPLLVADGLAKQLQNELESKPLLPERDGGNIVIHVGSVKLALYVRSTHNNFSAQLISMKDQDCIGMSFYCGADGLTVEYTSVTKYRGPDRFAIDLPDTRQHPLNQSLLRLYPLVVAALNDQSQAVLDKISYALR